MRCISHACVLVLTAAIADAQSEHPLPLLQTGNQTNAPSVLIDLDGDGRLDLVQVSSSASYVLHFGDGFGGFAATKSYPSTNQLITGPVVADIDEDGDLDILSTSGAGFLSRLMSNGSGDYALLPAPLIPELAGAVRDFAADLDGDGHLDLVAVTPATITVLDGDGLGSFGPPATYPKPQGSLAVGCELADVNGDGNLDVIARSSLTSVFVAAGNGLGGFLAPVNVPTLGNPVSIEVGDGDVDGDMDIFAAPSGNVGLSGVEWLPNLGGLAFGPSQPIPSLGPAANGLALFDLDDSGYPELIGLGGDVVVQVDALSPVPGAVVKRPIAIGQRTILAGRLDGDSAIDLVLCDSSQGRHATVVLGSPARLLQSGPAIDAGTSTFLAGLEDVDLDGDPDAIAVENLAGTVRVWTNDGGGAFAPGAASPIGHSGGGAIGSADLDGDSDLDLVVASPATPGGQPGHVTVLRAGPAGSFVAEPPIPLPGSPRSIAFGRFNADQALDFVVGDYDAVAANGAFHVIASQAGGYVVGAVARTGIDVPFLSQQPTDAFAAPDLDKDGFDDLVAHVRSSGTTTLHVFHCDGAGGFTPVQTVPVVTGTVTTGIVAGDFDGDGLSDIAVGPELPAFRGLQGGLLQATAPAATEIAAALLGRLYAFDVDEDGKDDVIRMARFSNQPTFGWHRSVGDMTFEVPRLLVGASPPAACLAGDLDNDGQTDFLTSGGQLSATGAPGPGSVLPVLAECEGHAGTLGPPCPLAGGASPHLAIDGCTEPLNVLTVRVDDARGAASALLVLGTSIATTALPNGCSLAVASPFSAVVALPIGAGGSAAFDAVIRPSFAGATIAAQALFQGTGATNAVELHIGP